MQRPDKTERRHPSEGSGAQNNQTATSVTQRRRRASALRLAPYGNGPVDPLDDLAGQPIGDPQDCHGAEFIAGGRVKPCRCRGAA